MLGVVGKNKWDNDTRETMSLRVMEPVAFGTMAYGAASGLHDIVSGATALKNRLSDKDQKLTFKGSAYAPLAVGAAGAAAGALLSDESDKLEKAAALGAVGYGATSFMRDAYQAYTHNTHPHTTQPQHSTATQHTPQHTHNPHS